MLRHVMPLAMSAATLIFLGLPTTSRAFISPVMNTALLRNTRQQQQQQQHRGNALRLFSASTKPSFKPSWNTPRLEEPKTSQQPLVEERTESSPVVSEVVSSSEPTAVQSVPLDPSTINGTSSTSRNFAKASWQRSPAKDTDANTNDEPVAMAPPSATVPKSSSNKATTARKSTKEEKPPSPVAGTEPPAVVVPPAPDTQQATIASPQPAVISEVTTSAEVPAVPDEPEMAAAPLPPSPTAAFEEVATSGVNEASGSKIGNNVDIGIAIGRAKEILAPFSKKIQSNIAEGNVGQRGEEWAFAQGVILLFVALGNIPFFGGVISFLSGPVLAFGGVAVIAAGLLGLGQSLSPWPAPVEDNDLKTGGIYGLMRHPTYTGLIMFCLGFGMLTTSPIRMLLAFVLALVLDKKAEKEEEMLVGLHGKDYEDYRATVAKFIPWLY